MRVSRRRAAFAGMALVLLLGLLGPGARPLRAWQDPFMDWTAGGYLQLLEINRPPSGRPPTGLLDSYADGAGGYTVDGPQFRILDLRLSGPLGWTDTSVVLETQVYLSTANVTNAYAQWDSGLGSFRLGQVYLPFGVEQQTSFKDLITIQRSLLYGFENYGATQPWGLQLMSQRGWGLRWDRSRPLGPFQGTVQAAGQDFQGAELYQNALGAVGRFALDWQRGAFKAQAAYSALLARGQCLTPPSEFTPLGAPQGAAMQPADDLAGKAVIKTWGPDAEAGVGPLHGRAEMALQSLDGLMRGGGQVTAWIDFDGALRALDVPPRWRGIRFYGKWEQAESSFGDGVHQAGALYRATTYGLGLPVGWEPASLRLEYLVVAGDSFGGILPDGRIAQAQLQFLL